MPNTTGCQPAVSPIANRQILRIAKRAANGHAPSTFEGPAGWQPAKQQIGNLRYALRHFEAGQIYYNAVFAGKYEHPRAHSQGLGFSLLVTSVATIDLRDGLRNARFRSMGAIRQLRRGARV